MDWALTFRVLAHELRAPTAVIGGYARMLREGRLAEADQARALEQIEHAASRLSQFSKQASDIGRWLGAQASGCQDINASELVARAVALAAVDADRIETKDQSDVDAVTISCVDPDAIAGAIATLIEAAAREAVTDPIRVVSRFCSSTPQTFDVLAGPASTPAWSGSLPGPDQGDAPGIERGGMGLAFILAAAVTMAHGGHLWSIGGRQGCTGSETAGRARIIMATAQIAIVDDDPLFVEYLRTFLKSRGYEATNYPSGAALLKSLGTKPPDAVLLDVLMPNMNGLETLRELQTAKPGLPVIMVSGQQVPATIVDAVRLGAIDYVVKSDEANGLNEASLEAAICRAIERVALKSEVERLSTQLAEPPDGAQLCWTSGTGMRDVLQMVDRVADSDVSVLLTGESGVGKEVIARELHRRSARRGKPFVKVNCAALPSELLESELFGHERGAFTGAQITRVGKFEFADQGTILLDEIGEMPVSLQAKLLHVVQDREFTKVGSNRPVAVDVRVIAATNRDLETMIRAGQFREDLYYRLQVIEIRVPPLRNRREEIPALTEFFLRRFSEQYGRPLLRPSPPVRTALSNYPWPGNVRELENTIKRFVILRDESMILAELNRERPADVMPLTAQPAAYAPPVLAAPPLAAAPANGSFAAGPAMPAAASAAVETPEHDAGIRVGKLPELARAAAMTAEREAIQQALDRFRWNRRKAALLLGVSYKTLLNKMKECGITAPVGLDADSL